MRKNPAELLRKWSDKRLNKLAITPKTGSESLCENLANLLENQQTKSWHGNLLTETSQGANTLSNIGGSINGIADVDAYKFKPVSLALVRRTFPALFANKCVGVQAMSTPVGLAYALRVVYTGTSREAAWDVVPEYSGYTGSISGTSGTRDTGTGASASDAEGWQIGGAYPQLSVKIDQQTITAMTRKLAASFSLESAQDLRAMHNIDIEREIVNVLNYELIAELDRELIYKLKAVAVDTTKDGSAAVSANFAAAAGAAGYVDGRFGQEQLASLLTAIVHQCNEIGRKTRRGTGNFAVVSPAVATALQAVKPAFIANIAAVNATQTGVTEIGTINGMIKVYLDTYADSDYALCGYKGPGENDAGVIYSPYITSVMNRTIHNDDFSPRIGVMSRYAITDSLLGAGRYYSLINVTNIGYAITK